MMYNDFLNERPRFKETPIAEGDNVGVLRKGQKVTISRNKRTGDRSWTDLIHEVEAMNAGSVQLRPIGGYSWTPEYLLLDRYEHEFYRVNNDFVIGEEQSDNEDLIDKIVDFEPNITGKEGHFSTEPSLKDLIYRYYRREFDIADSEFNMNSYIEKLKEFNKND